MKKFSQLVAEDLAAIAAVDSARKALRRAEAAAKGTSRAVIDALLTQPAMKAAVPDADGGLSVYSVGYGNSYYYVNTVPCDFDVHELVSSPDAEEVPDHGPTDGDVGPVS